MNNYDLLFYEKLNEVVADAADADNDYKNKLEIEKAINKAKRNYEKSFFGTLEKKARFPKVLAIAKNIISNTSKKIDEESYNIIAACVAHYLLGDEHNLLNKYINNSNTFLSIDKIYGKLKNLSGEKILTIKIMYNSAEILIELSKFLYPQIIAILGISLNSAQS